MTQLAAIFLPAPTPAPKTLAQEKADFTAEGSPPPGKVAGSVPTTKGRPGKPIKSVSRLPLTVPGGAK